MLLQYECTLFFTPVGVKSEIGSESRSLKDDLGKDSREKNIHFSYTVVARVGAREKVTKNDLGKVSNEPHFWKRWGVLAIILNLLK